MGSLDYLAEIDLAHRQVGITRGLRDRSNARAIEDARRGPPISTKAAAPSAQAVAPSAEAPAHAAAPACQPGPGRPAQRGA
jgi:hypothetical protein